MLEEFTEEVMTLEEGNRHSSPIRSQYRWFTQLGLWFHSLNPVINGMLDLYSQQAVEPLKGVKLLLRTGTSKDFAAFLCMLAANVPTFSFTIGLQRATGQILVLAN